MVKILIDRKKILLEILNIEEEIAAMRMNPTYLKIKQNLKHLEERRFGIFTIHIESPDDPDTILTMRSNSREMRETILRYREKYAEFDVQMNKLYSQKARLQDWLFKPAI